MVNNDWDQVRRLRIACARGQLDEVRTILQAKSVRWSKILVALRVAVENDQSSVVSLLLSEGFPYDYDCVLTAIKHESIATLQAFFDHKPGMNIRLFPTTMPPLGYALPLFCVVGMRNKQLTSSRHAVHSEHLVHWFLDRGADPNASVPSWPSPMDAAATKSSLSIVKLLRKHGGRVNHGVLQSAAKTIESGRVEVLEYLLDEGAAIDEVEYEWDPEPSRSPGLENLARLCTTQPSGGMWRRSASCW